MHGSHWNRNCLVLSKVVILHQFVCETIEVQLGDLAWIPGSGISTLPLQ